LNNYKNTGNAMLVIGVLSLVSSAISLISSNLQGTLLGGSPDLSQIQTLQNVFLVQGILSAVNVALLVWLVYNSYHLGGELDVGTFKFGAILLLIGQLYLVLITLIIYPQLLSIVQQIGSGGELSSEVLFSLLRLMSLMLLGSLLVILGYIVYGIGVRKVGEILGSDNIKNGGLLIILGFIPLLGPIGFILAGYSLRGYS